jgi:hypothetical protein
MLTTTGCIALPIALTPNPTPRMRPQAGGVAQLLSHPFSGEGTLEDMLGALGLAIAIAPLISMLHDVPESFLGAIDLLDFRCYEAAVNSPTI